MKEKTLFTKDNITFDIMVLAGASSTTTPKWKHRIIQYYSFIRN